MRTLVDIPESELRELTRLSKRRKVSRAAVIREAVSNYLRAQRPKSQSDIGDAFGLWKDLKIDSVEYQRKLRDEW